MISSDQLTNIKPAELARKRGHQSDIRIPALDGVRGIAVLGVMLMHFSQKQAPVSAIARGAHHVLALGVTGVDLFFVLSGFLITGILLDSRGAENFFRAFYGRRSVRIFPLYYGYLAILFCAAIPLMKRFNVWGDMQTVYEVSRTQWIYWISGSNVLVARSGHFYTGFVDHFWSLAIEEQFYLFWPAVVYLVAPRRLPLACISLVALAVLSRCAFIAAGTWRLAPYTLTICRADALAVGALVAIAIRADSDALNRMTQLFRMLFWVSGFFYVGFFLLRIRWSATNVIYEAIGKTFTATFFGAWIFLLVSASRWHNRGILASRPLRTLGKYSYGLYVFHVPIWLLTLRAMPAERLSRICASTAFVFSMQLIIPFSISFIIAWLSWHLYEKRFLRLKHFFHYQQVSAVPQPGHELAFVAG